MLIKNIFGSKSGMEKFSFLMVNQSGGGGGGSYLSVKNLDVNIDSITIDTDCRFLLLDCRISNIKYILLNLYAPAADTRCR